MNDVLAVLETYYDTAPRAAATAEEHGPFTVFVQTHADGWPYYARPRLGLGDPVSRADVDAVRARQREVRAPEALEWVHETTPSLLDAARSSGLHVEENPLLVLGDPVPAPATDAEVRVLTADDVVEAVVSAVHAGFSGSDEVEVRPGTRQVELMRRGLLALVGAYDDHGVVLGGGSHSPRGDATELTGIAVLPRARRRGVGAAVTAALVADARARGCGTVFLSAQDDAVARVYERVGFVRVGTACVAGTGR